MPRIVVTVISDLVTDQRVHKACTTLHDAGYEVLLIGSRRKPSLPLSARNYKVTRIHLLFQKKIWFYAEFNIRLFLKLLFTKADVFLGNDLDVMPATFFAARLKRMPVVYDTHEYFLGMGGMEEKPRIKNIWAKIEGYIFPKLQHIYTVCDSLANFYYRDYGKHLAVVRNVPYLQTNNTGAYDKLIKEIENKIPAGKRLLLFQGAGIHLHRGVEELVETMQYLDAAQYHLLIVGGGDIFNVIENKVKALHLQHIITIIPKVPFEVLRFITAKAHLGLSTDKPDTINHQYGLPNKIFDYIHAGVPVLTTRLVEIEKIVNRYQVGTFIESNDPQHTAAVIEAIFANPAKMAMWKQNTQQARQELNWEKESQAILNIITQVTAKNQ